MTTKTKKTIKVIKAIKIALKAGWNYQQIADKLGWKSKNVVSYYISRYEIYADDGKTGERIDEIMKV